MEGFGVHSSESGLLNGRELAASGQTVTAITLDSNVVIFAGDGRQHEFRIGNDILLIQEPMRPPLVVRYDPYRRDGPVVENITQLASIVADDILHARAYVDGTLQLAMGSGLLLSVEPRPLYEPWTYTYGDFILACPPGGFGA